MTRGEIYRIRLPARRGREQSGPRFGVIVQADELLGLSTAIVAPTSRSAAAARARHQRVSLASARKVIDIGIARAP